MSVSNEYYRLLKDQKQFAYSVKRSPSDYTYSYRDFKEYRQDRTSHYFNSDLKLVKSRSKGIKHEDCDEPECGASWYCDLCTDLNPVSDEPADESTLCGFGELSVQSMHVLERDVPVSPLLESDGGGPLCPDNSDELVGDSQNCEPVLSSVLDEKSLCVDYVDQNASILRTITGSLECDISLHGSNRCSEALDSIQLDSSQDRLPRENISVEAVLQSSPSFSSPHPGRPRRVKKSSTCLDIFLMIVLIMVSAPSLAFSHPAQLAVLWQTSATRLLTCSLCFQILVFDRGKVLSSVSGKKSDYCRIIPDFLVLAAATVKSAL